MKRLERTLRSGLMRVRRWRCGWICIRRRVGEMGRVGVHGRVIEREVGFLEGGGGGGR